MITMTINSDYIQKIRAVFFDTALIFLGLFLICDFVQSL